MSYNGQTFRIPCDIGGVNANENIDRIPPEAMIENSKNIRLDRGVRETRLGTAKVNTTAISGTPEIVGGFDYILQSGTAFQVKATDDGKIYKNSTTTITTGLTIDKIADFELFTDQLYVCNGANIPQMWDGAAASTVNLGAAGIAAPTAPTFTTGTLNRVTSATALAIGSTVQNVANGAFTYYLSNTSDSIAAVAAGTALSGDTVPQGSYGAWRLEVSVDGTIDIIQASSNLYGYDSANEAIAGLPSVSSNHVSMGTVTVIHASGDFVPGTTALNAGGVTAAYTDAANNGSVTAGAHSWKVTYVNQHGETVGSSASDQYTVRAIAYDGAVTLTIPTGGSTVTDRKIYRTITGDTGNYKLVAAVGDNTSTTYEDTTADGSLGADAPTTNTCDSRPTDWNGSNQPSFLVNHARGNSSRMVAGGVGSKLTTLYFSTSNDADDFVTDLQTLVIETNDGSGIVGGVSFVGRLLVFGRKQAFIIDDSDVTTPANWGYGSTAWNGGAGSHRLIVKTDVDVLVMAEDGEIYSVSAAEQFGDYKRASLTRASFMHNWIKDNVKLSEIAQFHGIWNPAERAVYWFIVRNGESTISTALIFYVDRPVDQAWMVQDNQDHNSGFAARSSYLVRHAVGDYRVYTGDYSGFEWKLGESTLADDSLGYYNGFKTPQLNFGDSNVRKNFKRARLVTLPEGNFEVSIRWWVDGTEQTTQTVDLSGAGAVYGTGIYDTDVYGGDEITDTSFELGQNGKRIQFEVFNTSPGERFRISQILVDYKSLGVVPD